MQSMIYHGLEKWFAKNCFVIILMMEFGWNFTLLGSCTKLFIEKKKWRRNWKNKIKKKKLKKKKDEKKRKKEK